MKAMRERMQKGLTITTKTAAKPNDERTEHMRAKPKVIVAMTEEQVHGMYRLGKQVMESTNTGMDVVFATRLKDGVQVVIKTRQRSNSFKSAREEREWRATTEYQLNMPKIASLCEFFEVLETPKYYYIVMEKCDGRDLFEQMAREKLPILDAREVVRQVLEALTAMHGSGRIHKDLKFENVMVDTNPKNPPNVECGSPVSAKIIDFDTVQDWEPNSPKTKDVLGTDGYIAPEAYSGDYSPASDIYAVGVIMYKLLTRKFPSRADIFDDQPGENYVGSPAMKRIKERLRKEQIDFTLPPLDRCSEARELVEQMLKFDPELRPTAADALKHPWFNLEPEVLSPKATGTRSSSSRQGGSRAFC